MVTKETVQQCTLNRPCKKRQHHNLGVIYLLTVMKSDYLNVPKFLFRLSLRPAFIFHVGKAKFLFCLCGCLVLSDY